MNDMIHFPFAPVPSFGVWEDHQKLNTPLIREFQEEMMREFLGMQLDPKSE